jgi:hypothetical protein
VDLFDRVIDKVAEVRVVEDREDSAEAGETREIAWQLSSELDESERRCLAWRDSLVGFELLWTTSPEKAFKGFSTTPSTSLDDPTIPLFPPSFEAMARLFQGLHGRKEAEGSRGGGEEGFELESNPPTPPSLCEWMKETKFIVEWQKQIADLPSWRGMGVGGWGWTG